MARHEVNHLSPALKGVVTKRETSGATSALDRLEHLYDRASRVLDASEAEGKASLSLAAVRELRGLVETLAKITGELDETPKVAVLNLSSSAEWLTTRAAMLDVLREYPDAGRAVAARLVELEALARWGLTWWRRWTRWRLPVGCRLRLRGGSRRCCVRRRGGCWCRVPGQVGKATTTSVRALHTALYRPGSLVLTISPSQRQSDEMLLRIRSLYRSLGRPAKLARDSGSELQLENGSRIVSLPGTEGTSRGFAGAALIVLDEPAR